MLLGLGLGFLRAQRKQCDCNYSIVPLTLEQYMENTLFEP